MKKYILMAILPILLSGKAFSADLDRAIQGTLKSAQTAIKGADHQITLDSVLGGLYTHAQLGDEQYNVAMAQIRSIKANLHAYKSQQYTGYWSNICWTFGKHPLSVVTEIDPAINKVHTAEASMIFNKYKGYGNDVVHIGKTSAKIVGLMALGAGLLYLSQNGDKLIKSEFWVDLITAPAAFDYSNIPLGFKIVLWRPFAKAAAEVAKDAIKI